MNPSGDANVAEDDYFLNVVKHGQQLWIELFHHLESPEYWSGSKWLWL